MSYERKSKAHGIATAEGRLESSKAIVERSEQRSELRLARDKVTGRYLSKLSQDDWATVLQRISNGDIEANICRDYGIARSTINEKRKHHPEFDEAYQEALFEGFINIAHDTRAIARGTEGYSSGDARRDELIVKTDMELAKKFAARILGDRLQIDQRTITVMLDSGHTDL